MTRVDKLEDEVRKLATNVNQAYERLLSLECYSRDFNLQFYNIPEDSNENCIEKLKTILHVSNDLGIKPVIDNAHRIGGPRTGASNDPRPVNAKFLYRLERLQIIQNKRSLNNDVRISDDLIWEDQQKKKVKEIMKQSYEEGKKPVFTTVICISMGFYIKAARLSLLFVGIVCDKFYENDPNLNLQSFNDHRIITIDELNELCNLLDSTPFTFDFIGCSETWLSPHSYLDCFSIPGYVFKNDNCTYLSGGGVGLSIKSDRNFHFQDDLRIDTIENVWIETQDLIIGVIYKPPSLSNCDFLDKLEENSHTIYLSKKCLIMDDDNILNLLCSKGFSPLIFEATRVTESN